MVRSCLPTWPLILFGVIEPILLIWATIYSLNDPRDYYIRQHSDPKLQQIPLTPQAKDLVFQWANIFILLAGMAIVCCWTFHCDIAKKYLFVVAIADIGHVWAIYASLGSDHFWNIGQWNDVVWGGAGVSIFLNINRWATLLGVFGPIKADNGTAKRID